VSRSVTIVFIAIASVASVAGVQLATAERAAIDASKVETAAPERASTDTSKLAKEAIAVSAKLDSGGRNKLCCGYPLSEEMGFALRFYWLAFEDSYDEDYDEVDVYTRQGWFLGSYPERFVKSIRMEGSGVLADGRVINYAGRCRFGVGTCFEQLDPTTHPFGRGAGRRPLVPFKSVAVDQRLIPIGEPLYIPEFDGMLLPDGSVHDGCVRADDTGGGIKQRKMDFFVISYDNFRFLLDRLWGTIWITPHIEAPRCEYLRRDPDALP
jgi:3D (Asp-Asp-Asp) domain-containing protein